MSAAVGADVRPKPVPRHLAVAPALAGVPGIPPDLTVTGVTLDSRRVQPGDVYAALPGLQTHGARFTHQALAAGAVAVVTDPAGAAQAGPASVPVITVPDPRGLLGELSAWTYGHPARAMTVLGVTGTNGKTTVTYLLAAALTATGHSPGIIGTIGVRIGDEALPSARTTPEAPDVHALLAVMRERGVDTVAMEVSSHALALGRVDGLRFDVSAFTNLSQDHLDFHADLDDYFRTKASLFRPDRSAAAVVCVDDDWGRTIAGELEIPGTTYAIGAAADWTLGDLRTTPTGAWQGTATGPQRLQVPLRSVLPGTFNQANTLGALALLVAAGVPAADAAAGLATCTGIPGRLEPVGGAPFGAFVDYAHTPDAVARVIAAVREFASGRVLVALGCGGDRDPGKRPLMGKVAAVGADVLVVTDDNPRSEEPAVIRRAMLAGIAADPAASADVIEIGDRGAAIAHLVGLARAGDAVLILGKGHEQGQEAVGVVTPFDDRLQLAAAIEGLTS